MNWLGKLLGNGEPNLLVKLIEQDCRIKKRHSIELCPCISIKALPIQQVNLIEVLVCQVCPLRMVEGNNLVTLLGACRVSCTFVRVFTFGSTRAAAQSVASGGRLCL